MEIRKTIYILALMLMSAMQTIKAQGTNHNFEIAKNLDIFNALYRDLDLYYVDTLDASKNINNAAQYMLSFLDPYTTYFAEQDTEDLKQLTTGKYAGIGVLTSYRADLKRCVVAKPFADMPAAQVGMQAGDIIINIDGRSIAPCSSDDKEEQAKYANEISAKMRGEAGTTFEMKVRRPHTDKVYTFKITRRSIVRPSVTLSAMADDSVGIIKL